MRCVINVTHQGVSQVEDGATADVLHGTLARFNAELVDSQRVTVRGETMNSLANTLLYVRHINTVVKQQSLSAHYTAVDDCFACNCSAGSTAGSADLNSLQLMMYI